MAQITTPTGDTFEESNTAALNYYRREPGYKVDEGQAVAPTDEATTPVVDGEPVVETVEPVEEPARSRRGRSASDDDGT